MSVNLPLELDQDTSALVHHRVELALNESLRSSLFVYDDHHPANVRKEHALGAYRWAMRELEPDAPAEFTEPDLAKGTDPGVGAGGEGNAP